MADQPLHTIRFKRGSTEFELTSDAGEVAKARAALEPALLAAFAGSPLPDDGDGEEQTENGETLAKQKRARRKRATTGGGGGAGDARAEIRQRLLDAELKDFPQIGEKPPGLYAAYAVLSWAHKSLGIDGLTAQEIQAFMTSKWRLAYAYQSYSGPMNKRLRFGEVHASGTSPKIFKLMGPGETALKTWLAEQAAKASKS